jgi:hypothetical protein
VSASAWIGLVGGIGCGIVTLLAGPAAPLVGTACGLGVATAAGIAEAIEAGLDGDTDGAVRAAGYTAQQINRLAGVLRPTPTRTEKKKASSRAAGGAAHHRSGRR